MNEKDVPERIALVLASAISNLSGAFMKSKNVSPQIAVEVVAVRHGTVGPEQTEPISSSKRKTQTYPAFKEQRSFLAALASFDDLPDSALVRQPVVLGLFPCSKATLWRWVKSSRIPAPIKLGNRISAWQVGPLRECLRQIEGANQLASKMGGKG